MTLKQREQLKANYKYIDGSWVLIIPGQESHAPLLFLELFAVLQKDHPKASFHITQQVADAANEDMRSTFHIKLFDEKGNHAFRTVVEQFMENINLNL